MITMKSSPVELRGAVVKQTKNGKSFVLLNVENENGEHYQFYSPDTNVVSNNFKKGDMVVLVCSYTVFDRQERLSVVGLEKVQ